MHIKRSRCFIVMLCMLASISNMAFSSDDLTNVNAGIIAYSCKPDGAHYLLAFDPHPKRQGWGSFGGRPNPGESAKQTALREFYEETNCVYTPELLNNVQLKGPSQSRRFYSFLTRVPYVSINEIEQVRACQNVERSQWVWIPHSDFMQLVSSKNDQKVIQSSAHGIHLWDGAKASLKQASADALIPSSDPCL